MIILSTNNPFPRYYTHARESLNFFFIGKEILRLGEKEYDVTGEVCTLQFSDRFVLMDEEEMISVESGRETYLNITILAPKQDKLAKEIP